MARFDKYLFRETLAPLLFSLLLYSVLAVVSVTLPRLQWIVGVPLGSLSYWLLLQLPAALVQTLPIALVLAVLLVFGRLASSNEMLAAQAGGISLLRIGAVFVVLGTAFAGLALGLNEWVLPTTNAKVGSLYWQLTGNGRSGLWRLAAQNIPLDGYTLYFEQPDPKTEDLLGVRIEAWDDKRLNVFFAERAVFKEEGLELHNFEGSTLNLAALGEAVTQEISSQELLERLVLRINKPPRADQTLLLTVSESKEDLVTRFSGGGFEDSRSLGEVYKDSQTLSLSVKDRRKAAVLFHRKLAEPLANLTLLLVAIPLSLLYARSRSVAFGLSLVVTLAWYLMLTVGQLLAQTGAMPVWTGIWMGNVLLASFGLYLLLVRARLR